MKRLTSQTHSAAMHLFTKLVSSMWFLTCLHNLEVTFTADADEQINTTWPDSTVPARSTTGLTGVLHSTERNRLQNLTNLTADICLLGNLPTKNLKYDLIGLSHREYTSLHQCIASYKR